jgi:hypothetical protein
VNALSDLGDRIVPGENRRRVESGAPSPESVAAEQGREIRVLLTQSLVFLSLRVLTNQWHYRDKERRRGSEIWKNGFTRRGDRNQHIPFKTLLDVFWLSMILTNLVSVSDHPTHGFHAIVHHVPCSV